ncbi:DivIVA domain-containing protein [Cellulomonas soli]
MSDARTPFPVVNFRGYDRDAVDARLRSLEQALSDARAQVETLDQKTMQVAGELSEAHRQLREAERPTYSGLGSRIEQLLRSAEEQSSDVVTQANAQAADSLARAKLSAGQTAGPGRERGR